MIRTLRFILFFLVAASFTHGLGFNKQTARTTAPLNRPVSPTHARKEIPNRQKKTRIAAEQYYRKGMSLAAAGRYAEAAEAFRQSLRLTPAWAEALNNLGASYHEMGGFEQAEASFKQAIRLRADFAEAYYNLGSLYDDGGRLEEAIEAFKQAIRFKQDYAWAYAKLGESYYKTEQFDEALESLRKGIELQTDNTWGRYTLGLVYLKLGDGENALKQYNALHSLDAKLSDELFKRIVKTSADVQLESLASSPSADASELQRLTLKPPFDSPEMSNTGARDTILQIPDKPAIVRDVLRRTDEPLHEEREEKRDPISIYAEGKAFAESGDYEKAIASYAAAINADANHVAAYYELGTAYEATGRNEEAIKAYQQVIEREPNNFCALKNLSWTYMRLQRWLEASGAYAQALKLRADNELSAYNKCEAYFDSYEPRYNLGAAYLELQQYSEAADAFKDAVRRNPKDAGSHYGLGRAHLALGERDAAAEQYRILSTLDKELAKKFLGDLKIKSPR
ncbi:MAG: tetratricopeptide repeat protein [Pyrinomonadaceae bacterium]